ncbi:MAG: BolA family protein [Ostreibacterium sp.]
MNTQDIQTAIEVAFSTDFVLVESADNIHFYVTVVSPVFDGLTKIKQHKMVKDLFSEQFANESIHAMSLKTYTPQKWAILQAQTE